MYTPCTKPVNRKCATGAQDAGGVAFRSVLLTLGDDDRQRHLDELSAAAFNHGLALVEGKEMPLLHGAAPGREAGAA